MKLSHFELIVKVMRFRGRVQFSSGRSQRDGEGDAEEVDDG